MEVRNQAMNMCRAFSFGVLLGLMYSIGCRAEQFVEIKAEIEINDWDFWLIRDRRAPRPDDMPNLFSKSVFHKSEQIRCIVGTNTWLMEGNFVQNGNVSQWFTGTNIIRHTVITGDEVNPATKHAAQAAGIVLTTPPIGSSYTNTYDSSDGNPGRPVRVTDLLQPTGRIAWLAFCSGPVLKESNRKIYPPSDLWKELVAAPPSGFPDSTTV